MTRQTIGGLALTDHDLVAACYSSRVAEYRDTGRRVYRAVFAHRNGVDYADRTFAVGHAEAAAVYAREYAARIMDSGSWRVASVRWDR